MSNTYFDRVSATLSTLVNDQYKTYNILLDLEVKQLWGRGGIEDEAIAKAQIAAGSAIPDGGPYTLRYSYHGKPYELIGLRMQFGHLLQG
ncbi:MAG TPA: hypothetical protein VKV30_02390 [Candidatus Angelobacter sp.]|nr:hypothetical protein [Candidatus Angelobacter sp.]